MSVCVCVGPTFFTAHIVNPENLTNITVIKYRNECILAWMRININLEMYLEA